MKALDLKKIRKVENLTKSDRQIIIDNTREIFDDDIPIIGYYIVGSFCFNIDEPNDMDIVVVVPESYRRIVFPSNEGIGYDLVNASGKHDIPSKEWYGIKVQHMSRNPEVENSPWANNKGLEPRLGITQMPYYDLETGQLYHKEWDAVMDITFAWSKEDDKYHIKTREETNKVGD